METTDAKKMLKGAIDRYIHNDSIDNENAIMEAVDVLVEVIESEKDETGGKYDQLIKRLAELTEVTKGKINQRLQIILSTAQNCRKEIKAGTIPGKKIVYDLERIAENVGDITAIMDGGSEIPMIKRKPFYVNYDGEIRCAACDESMRDATIKLAEVEVSLFITPDGHMADHEWDYGKVSLVCSCGLKIPENTYTWERLTNDWRLTIKEDAIEDKRKEGFMDK